jgi:hypothetical protein
MRPLLVVVAIGLAVSAVPARAATPLRSGRRLTVTIGPTCPVERPDDPACADRPYDARLRIVDLRVHRVVTTVRSGSDGRVSVALRPRRYLIRPLSPGSARIPDARPVTATVAPRRYTAVLIAYDSGIR